MKKIAIQTFSVLSVVALALGAGCATDDGDDPNHGDENATGLSPVAAETFAECMDKCGKAKDACLAAAQKEMEDAIAGGASETDAAIVLAASNAACYAQFYKCSGGCFWGASASTKDSEVLTMTKPHCSSTSTLALALPVREQYLY
jgi:hypothetical protein